MALETPIRLTSLSHGSGCACKIGPGELREILQDLPRPDDPDVLVAAETADDAGVYRLGDGVALAQSVDFFTPIVDDPYDFGRIAATNALSDLYAMGARPLTALNLVALSLEALGPEVLRAVLRGGADTAETAGVAILGGHSIDDPEPKYGMAVTGIVHPDRVVRNSTASAGDVLFLTKPIGSGAVATASKRGKASAELVERSTAVMTELNGAASEAALAVGLSAMTDVTGFGLLGHVYELASASGVGASLQAAAIPLVEGVRELFASADAVSGGSRRNREFVEPLTSFDAAVPEELRALLCDATTSGGLLVASPPDRAEAMEKALANVAPASARIGLLTTGERGHMEVV